MIRDCYPDDDSRAMAFFGRLFEHYIQTLTEESTKINEYNYIKEFSYTSGRNRKLSSDSYIRKGNNLLAIEAKGFSVLQICMTRNKNVEFLKTLTKKWKKAQTLYKIKSSFQCNY